MARSKKDEVLDRIASTATEDEKRALAEWSDKVLTIYKSDSTNLTKLKETATTTANFRTIKPIIALIGRELSPRELTELSDKLVNLQQSQVALPTKLRQGTSLIAAALKDLAWDRKLPLIVDTREVELSGIFSARRFHEEVEVQRDPDRRHPQAGR